MPKNRNHHRDTAWGIKVLLIDDDVRDLECLFRILESQGHEVIRCTNYDLGAKLAESEVVDFVIVSQGSREFQGRVVLERVSETGRRCPVLVMARAVDMNCYLEAMQLGATDYIEKPVPLMEMVRVLSAMRGHDHLPR